jgi:hypothetical protein
MKRSIIHVAVTISLAVMTGGCASAPSSVARSAAFPGSYPIVGTGQLSFWDTEGRAMAAPAKGDALYGQDAQHPGTAPSYQDNGDGTVSDLVTGLMWTQSLDRNGDGTINKADKSTYREAMASASNVTIGGYSDWRLPTIKELYSLIDFNGLDPRLEDRDASRGTPFIDGKVFRFGYGDVKGGERIIDAQVATATLYLGKTGGPDMQTMFGVNFADGRIKGYGLGPLGDKPFYVFYVRGNLAYGVNSFVDKGNGTITDETTSLMWSKADSGAPVDWREALAWVQTKNSENYLGHDDWRLPDVKELQSLVDYTRAPGVTGSAALAPVFVATSTTNELGESDFGFYWSSTTHVSSVGNPGERAAYISFGKGTGKMNGTWMDVHGAGAQRSDPKVGDASRFPKGRGPQGDAIRIQNFVRLVRDSQEEK